MIEIFRYNKLLAILQNMLRYEVVILNVLLADP